MSGASNHPQHPQRASRGEIVARIRAAVPPWVRRIVTYLIRNIPGRRADWGTLRQLKPLSNCHGWDRGLPVDRHYIEGFLQARGRFVHGDVLEVRSATYTRRFGSDLDRVEVVDIDPHNREATLTVDLCVEGSLPANSFDCVIITQTLHFLPAPRQALKNMWDSLRPGGTILMTVPSLNRADSEAPESDYWRFTPVGLQRLLEETCPTARIEVEGHGNMLVSIATLLGLAVEELDGYELQAEDSDFPVIACGCVHKLACAGV
jgi:SAM-dependent methyltransferase